MNKSIFNYKTFFFSFLSKRNSSVFNKYFSFTSIHKRLTQLCKKIYIYWNSEFLDIDTYLRFLSPFIPFLHSSKKTHVNTDEQKDLSNEIFFAETERKQILRKEGKRDVKK